MMLQPCCTHAQYCPGLTKPACYNISTRHVSLVPLRPRLPAAQVCQGNQLRLPCRNSNRGRLIVSAIAAGNQPDKSQGAAQPVSKQNYSAVSAASVSNTTGTGVFILLLINLIVFVLDHSFHLPQIRTLYLDHIGPKWWQFITSSFCHASWQHLSSNTFLLYVFGKIVEEEEGIWGVWLTYLITAVGASVASYFLLPKATVSLGASGAVFGLFAVSVLVKLSFNLKKLIECGILGQFVIKQLLQETVALRGGGTTIAGVQVGHIAHLGGAFAGVLLVYALSRIPAKPKKKGSWQ